MDLSFEPWQNARLARLQKEYRHSIAALSSLRWRDFADHRGNVRGSPAVWEGGPGW